MHKSEWNESKVLMEQDTKNMWSFLFVYSRHSLRIVFSFVLVSVSKTSRKERMQQRFKKKKKKYAKRSNVLKMCPLAIFKQ